MQPGTSGQAAEKHACTYLESAGLVLLDRNYRCRTGEIDLVMQDADTLVFVEVRYRRRNTHGSAAESVDARKQAKLASCAAHYLQARTDGSAQNCRFDVVAIDGPDYRIQWIRNAFT